MNISGFRVLVFFAILSVLGIFMVTKLSVRLNPSKTLPSITVSYQWPNASSYSVENKITTVLESGFNTIKGLKNITSKSNKNNGHITLEFDKYTDIDVARFDVATIVRNLYKKLPEQSTFPLIFVNRPDENEARAFLVYSIHANEVDYIGG